MRFRLRYLHHDLELSAGEFALGRSAECQLSLDDPLVSRRHALLIVAKDGVTIEDLQSRNGVVVNGERITGRMPLKAGDRILIGSQELTLLVGHEALERELLSTTLVNQGTLPKIAVAGWRESSGTPPPGASVRASSERTEPGVDIGIERRADAFNLLGGVAEKALAMGRAEEAERLLASALGDVVEASRLGRRPSPSLVDVAARFAAKLATAAPVIDELYGALRKVSAIDLTRLRAYVAHLRERQAMLGPAEKFLLQRIEGLERLAALR
jgi:hypothetical protein